MDKINKVDIQKEDIPTDTAGTITSKENTSAIDKAMDKIIPKDPIEPKTGLLMISDDEKAKRSKAGLCTIPVLILCF